jgi:hypothetical protein
VGIYKEFSLTKPKPKNPSNPNFKPKPRKTKKLVPKPQELKIVWV